MAIKLVCKQCGYENEGERIYCHSCGAKLDRTVLPTEKKGEEPLEETRRRVKRMTNPQRGFFAGWYKTLLATAVWAALAAGIFEASQPPDGVPPMPKKGDFADAPPIALKLEEISQQPAAQRLIMSAEIINNYLRNTVKSGPDQGMLGDTVKFERAFVNLREGACRITSQQTAFDYPLYASADYQLAIQNKKLVATSVGGSIGRLPLHPLLMQYSDLLFQKLWDALSREHKLLDGMGSIVVHKDQIVIISKGAAPPP